MTGAVDSLLPDTDIIGAPENVNISSVGTDLLCGHIVKGKDVFDYAVLVLVDGAVRFPGDEPAAFTVRTIVPG